MKKVFIFLGFSVLSCLLVINAEALKIKYSNAIDVNVVWTMCEVNYGQPNSAKLSINKDKYCDFTNSFQEIKSITFTDAGGIQTYWIQGKDLSFDSFKNKNEIIFNITKGSQPNTFIVDSKAATIK